MPLQNFYENRNIKVPPKKRNNNDCNVAPSDKWSLTIKMSLVFQISWVRHRDIHLLTVGRDTYTSDQRFQALHKPHTEEWTLQIRYPQVSRLNCSFHFAKAPSLQAVVQFNSIPVNGPPAIQHIY